jgi:hypothetical protein
VLLASLNPAAVAAGADIGDAVRIDGVTLSRSDLLGAATSVAERVGRAHRVAVHRRDVVRRLGEAGGRGGGADAAPGLGQRHHLGGRRREAGQDAGAGVLDADHPLTPG